MEDESLNQKIRTLEWRDYVKFLKLAVEENLVLNDADASWAVIQIPEHYKLCALVDYSQKVKPICVESFNLIKEAISDRGGVGSYQEHLLEVAAKMAVSW